MAGSTVINNRSSDEENGTVLSRTIAAVTLASTATFCCGVSATRVTSKLKDRRFGHDKNISFLRTASIGLPSATLIAVISDKLEMSNKTQTGKIVGMRK